MFREGPALSNIICSKLHIAQKGYVLFWNSQPISFLPNDIKRNKYNLSFTYTFEESTHAGKNL